MKFLTLFYTVFWYVALPFVMLRLLWRSRRQPAYRERWWERFGFFKGAPFSKSLWIHAVSLGETRAALPLIERLKILYPEQTIVVSTTTPTGAAQVKAAGLGVQHIFFPYDFPGALKRCLKHLNPCCLIIMETELWPGLFEACRQRAVPIVVANARLSARSAEKYRRFLSAVTPMMQCVTQVAAQTEADKAELESLGLPGSRLTVTGSLKFDLRLPEDLGDKASALKAILGQRPIILAASTHPGEESALLSTLQQVKAKIPTVLLVIAPRHVERAADIVKLCQQHSCTVAVRSQSQACDADTSVYLANTVGELLYFYEACDVAYVGGSLIPHGGQNPLEPAACGKPIVMGPHVFNFTRIVALLKTAGALTVVDDTPTLAKALIELLESPEKRADKGQRARHVMNANRGALDRQLEVIQAVIDASSDVL